MVRRWLLPLSGGLALHILMILGGLPAGHVAPARAAPLQASVDLLQTTYYPNARGGLVFVGVAQNNTGQALAGLDIALTLLGADQTPVALGVSGGYGRAYLPAGTRLPFALALPAARGPWVRQRWDLVPHFDDPAWFLDQQLARGLQIAQVTRQPAGATDPMWGLQGLIQNTDSRPARLVAVHAALYDARQRLLDAGYVNLTAEAILPGRQIPFTFAFPRARRGAGAGAQDVFVTGVRK